MDVDVVVVGAGLAGLRAADLLARAGRSVLVLEARDRVGGRLLSRRIGGATFDLGGQWIGASQHRVAGLAGELGLETFPTHEQGRKVLVVGGEVRTYSGTIPRLDPLSLIEMQLTLNRIDRIAGASRSARPTRARRPASSTARRWPPGRSAISEAPRSVRW